MYSVISKTTVLFVREVRALGIFGLSVAPRHRAKKCVIFSRANIFRVRIFFATSQIGFENRSKRTTSLPGRRPIMDSIRTRTLTTTTIHRSSDLVSTRRFPFSVASCMQWLLFIVLADQK
jgi:hypothetical protein